MWAEDWFKDSRSGIVNVEAYLEFVSFKNVRLNN